jgi:hypothetical protein
MFDETDELTAAANLIAKTIEAANLDRPLPPEFPRRMLSSFADYGKSLAHDEWIEQRPVHWDQPVRYDAIARSRLGRYADAAYEADVDLTGTVTMARWSKPRMANPNGRLTPDA